MRLVGEGKGLDVAAAKSGMSKNTARRYQGLGVLPSAVRAEHNWRTRPDPLKDVWPELEKKLESHPGLLGTTLFEDLVRQYPGVFSSGQLRTLQRRIKQWQATKGPGQAVIFPQLHYPGQLGASDFCHMSKLGVTLQGMPFDHLLYHFMLTYSNWETGSVCFTESFESLSEGLQSALWELGGVPQRHRTDCLTAAVYELGDKREFTRAYQSLMDGYGMSGEHIQAGQANENGDIEQRHYRFRSAVDQALMLRGSRDFISREAYECFLKQQFRQVNGTRRDRFQEEQAVLKPLPASRLDATVPLQVRVGPSSTIRVKRNVYSVSSRLIGEMVQVRLRSEVLEVWYGQALQETLPRLRGSGQHRVSYRHVIDSLARKPGAFDQYRWKTDLFPSSHFRQAYDALRTQLPDQRRASKEYLAILLLAARESEQQVQDALRLLLLSQQPITSQTVATLVKKGTVLPAPTQVQVAPVNLKDYDDLLPASQPSLAAAEVAA